MALRVDHFAVAVRSIDETLEFYSRYLPLVPNVAKRDGYSGDFRWSDAYLGHVKIEFIESARPGSFVERFLERRGEGIHHLTFDTDAIEPLLRDMESAGVRIVDRFDAGDGDETAFVSPRSAHGMLLQFWQVPEVKPPPAEKTRPIVRLPGVDARMRFDHLSAAVGDIPEAMSFFRRWFPIAREAPRHPGYAGDFELLQFDVGDFRVELIADLSGTSFVKSFLAKRGEGFHHLSIDVDAIDPVLERMEADGVRIVDRADLGNGYRTAFVSPRSAHGVLIQFWQVPELESGNW
jgi:methylmalonyl-CoA epimerase